jgi:hypothetical protein
MNHGYEHQGNPDCYRDGALISQQSAGYYTHAMQDDSILKFQGTVFLKLGSH